MDILDQIIAFKRREVADRQLIQSINDLEKSPFFERKTASMVAHLRQPGVPGIIAEFKRKSPSKGMINAQASVEKVTGGYVQAGASGLSILTDSQFFGGSTADLMAARTHTTCPILRKEFIVHEYQIIEAKAMGADMILLIARVLTKAEVARFAALANSLGMEVLLEIHEESELDTLDPHVQIVGVNNRNLQTFETSIDTSKGLAAKIPAEFLKISESGIHHPDVIIELRSYGFEGFLIGEQFMQSVQPERACHDFIQALQAKSQKP